MVDLSPLKCVIADITKWRVDFQSSLLLDLKRVESLVKSRGISFLMIDMPDACKVLDASLSRGYCSFENMPHTIRGKSKNGQYFPQLFGCLFIELFDGSGNLHSDPDVNVIFFLRQLLLLFKKVDIPCPQKNVDKAIGEFLQIENRMRSPTLSWHCDQLDFGYVPLSFVSGCARERDMFGGSNPPTYLLHVLDCVASYVTSKFPVMDPLAIIPKHGPGAVADLKTGADKYQFPAWPKKLAGVFEFETFGLPNYNFIGTIEPSDVEPYAKLIAVPKTLKSPRLIASEPTCHQFLQQGLLKWFRRNLPKPLRRSIDFNSQEKSRELALLSSRDDLYATVDLSSASDRLSCWVVERFFRDRYDILSSLHAIRTRALQYEHEGQSGRILLKKYANQGSAVTFPLQSIIYACICAAAIVFDAYKVPTSRVINKAFSEVRVFGDDICLPSGSLQTLEMLMSYLGLSINWGKTHFKRGFRESCGIDAYDGVDITPVYLSSLSPGVDYSGLSSWVDVSNVAYSRGLWTLSRYMIDCIEEKKRRLLHVSPVPLSALYLRTSQRFTYVQAKTRWDKNHQVVTALSLTSSVKKTQGDRVMAQDLLHYFISEEGTVQMSLPIDAFSISRKRSFGYRVRLRTRWVPLTGVLGG